MRNNPNVDYVEPDATVSLNEALIYSAIADGNGTTDCNGHGTHVAGTVGGSQFGVAKGVTLVPVRVLDCTGSGSYSGVIAGDDWVAGKSAMRLAVANMSLGDGLSASVNALVAGAVAKGVTMVAAAGNSSADACQTSPVSKSSAIMVGATTMPAAVTEFLLSNATPNQVIGAGSGQRHHGQGREAGHQMARHRDRDGAAIRWLQLLRSGCGCHGGRHVQPRRGRDLRDWQHGQLHAERRLDQPQLHHQPLWRGQCDGLIAGL